jgi:hypothetical protein
MSEEKQREIARRGGESWHSDGTDDQPVRKTVVIKIPLKINGNK